MSKKVQKMSLFEQFAKSKSEKHFVYELSSILSDLEYSLGKNRMIPEEDVQILQFRLDMIREGDCKDKSAIDKTYNELLDALEKVKSKNSPISNNYPSGEIIPKASRNLDRFEQILENENVKYTKNNIKDKIIIRTEVLYSADSNGVSKFLEYIYNREGLLIQERRSR